MKKHNLLLILLLLLTTSSISQTTNNTLNGKVLFLSSGKKPAVGVKIIGSIDSIENANTVYTLDKGEFILRFPKARVGHKVKLQIGEEDRIGTEIELVNIKEVEQCRIPAKPTDAFEIIVCHKGERDVVAQKYYNIIKTSSAIALADLKNELNRLINASEKDYEKIYLQSELVAKLAQQIDSLTIYREAFRIASINRDNASKRVLKYLDLLDEGKSIQEARQVLSIKGAAIELKESIVKFDAAIKELETRALSSSTIFDFKDAIACYDTIINYMETLQIDSDKKAFYYSKAVKANYNDGNYKQALFYQKKILNIKEQNLGNENLETAIVYNETGRIYLTLGQYEKALKLLQKSLIIQESKLTQNHPDLAQSFNSMGNINLAMGMNEEALSFYRKALDIRIEILDSLDSQLATSFNNIAVVYKDLGEYSKNLEYLQKAISIEEKIFGKEHPSLAFSYSNIGNTYNELGNDTKALYFHQKAVGIFEKTLNPKHPLLANSYNNIANTYSSIGEFEKALEIYKKAMVIREELFSPMHPSLAISYNNIASCYKTLAQYRKALEFEQKALTIQEIILNPKHPNLAIIYINIGSTYSELENYEEALKYQKKGLIILEEILDPLHLNLSIAYAKISYTYQKLNNYELALEYLQKAIPIQEKILDSIHPTLAVGYSNMGTIYSELDELEKALEYQKKAISIQEKINPTHLNLGINYGNTASTYRKMKNFTKAEIFQKKCATILKNALPEDHPYQKMAFSNWLRIYKARAIDSFLKKNYSAALTDFDTIHVYPDNKYFNYKKVYNYTGLCYLHLADYPKAIKAFLKAAILSPDLKQEDFFNNIGIAYAKNKQFQEANNAFAEYEKLFPYEGQAYRNWAMYHALQNQKERALTNLQKAIDLGYNDLEWLQTDDSLNNIRNEKQFQKLIKQLEMKR